MLVPLDVEIPIGVEVAREIDGAEFDDGLGHRRGPTHAASFHAVLDQVLAGTFHRAAGNRPGCGTGSSENSARDTPRCASRDNGITVIAAQ